MNSTSRRSFLQKTMTAGVMGLGFNVPLIGKNKKISLTRGDIILIQGDSITDSGRNREELTFNSGKAFGNGYAMIAGSSLLLKHAEKDLKIYNRGISGNKVFQLAERWDTDCLGLKPTILSVLIGVNDFWHMKNGKYDGTIETYKNDYRSLLKRTKTQLPDVKLILGEPFAVAGIKAVDETWFPAFQQYQQAAKELAAEFDATFIPFQRVFDEAMKSAPGVYWTHDGVHPSLAGCHLMAKAWLEAF